MQILITGSNGFIGQNLVCHLNERAGFDISTYTRETPLSELEVLVDAADVIIHLAGENRPKSDIEFEKNNVELSKKLCDILELSTNNKMVLFSSSTQSGKDSVYGKSKRSAERYFEKLSKCENVQVGIVRFPNVFGKWCKPNYNSVVATFCHNLIFGKKLIINDPSVVLKLVYIDDVVQSILSFVKTPSTYSLYFEVEPTYQITLSELAATLSEISKSRETLTHTSVGIGLERALHATYTSYLPKEFFSTKLKPIKDDRGSFTEVWKSSNSGQISLFTADSGVTRGGHYHHTKTEKFLVVQGEARFRFKNILTGLVHELNTCSNDLELVETVPGWAHDITNIGTDILIVVLWSSEVFDESKPDTVKCLI